MHETQNVIGVKGFEFEFWLTQLNKKLLFTSILNLKSESLIMGKSIRI